MKRLMLMILTVAMLLVVVAGCEKTPEGSVDETLIQLAGSQKEILDVAPAGESMTIRFTAAAEWTARVAGKADWLVISPAEGAAGMARVNVDVSVNDSDSERTAVIELCCSGSAIKKITISQEVFIPTFEMSRTERSMSCLGGTFAVVVTADVEYDFDISVDWIKESATKAGDEFRHEFVVNPNAGGERTGVITFRAGELSKVFTVTQRPAGTSEDDWKNDPFRHRSLAMRFTADWCAYCPYMATAFSSAKVQLNDGLEIVSIHTDGSSYDFSDANTLTKRFGVSSLPAGVMDFRAKVENQAQTEITASHAVAVARETEDSYPVTTGISCGSTLDGDQLTVSLDLYIKEADTYRVVVLLLEDGIVGYQNNGGDDYVHNDVARLALTSMNGDKVEAADCQIVNRTYTGTVKSSWDKDNLEILVYVEKPYGTRERVKGVTAATYGDYGDTYIDNCRIVKVGTQASLELE